MIDLFSFEAVSTLHVAMQVLAIGSFYTLLILLLGLIFAVLVRQTFEFLSRFFRESSWFRIIRTTCLALFFSVAITGHRLGHLNIFSGYVIFNLAMGVVSIVMLELIEFADQKEKMHQEKEENPPIQDDENENESKDEDKEPDSIVTRRRSQRKRKATVTFADEREEESNDDKATKLD